MPAPKYIPHYTVDDYRQWEGDWELWDGLAVSMTPSPFGSHQKCLAEFAYRILHRFRTDGCSDCEVLLDCDWTINSDTVLRPDISIVCGTVTDKHIETTPTLIVEILSDTTRHKDQTAKRDRYQTEGVRHYLLVDLDARTTVRLELDQQHRYVDRTDSLDPIQLTTNCSLPSDIFQPA